LTCSGGLSARSAASGSISADDRAVVNQIAGEPTDAASPDSDPRRLSRSAVG
jgi:hypothetical protein